MLGIIFQYILIPLCESFVVGKTNFQVSERNIHVYNIFYSGGVDGIAAESHRSDGTERRMFTERSSQFCRRHQRRQPFTKRFGTRQFDNCMTCSSLSDQLLQLSDSHVEYTKVQMYTRYLFNQHAVRPYVL